MTLALGINVNRPRCPYCHDEVRPDEPKVACAACMGWQHAACLAENAGVCAACGREGTALTAGRAPGPGSKAPPRAPEVSPQDEDDQDEAASGSIAARWEARQRQPWGPRLRRPWWAAAPGVVALLLFVLPGEVTLLAAVLAAGALVVWLRRRHRSDWRPSRLVEQDRRERRRWLRRRRRAPADEPKAQS